MFLHNILNKFRTFEREDSINMRNIVDIRNEAGLIQNMLVYCV